MSKKLLSTQNIVGLSVDPVSGSAGEMYYNISTNKLRFYNGSAWADISSGSSAGFDPLVTWFYN